MKIVLKNVLGFDPFERLESRGANWEPLYVSFSIGRSGPGAKPRKILAPCNTLKEIQRAILKNILSQVAPHPAATAYYAGRSIASNAMPHLGCELLYKTDIVDFFTSIKSPLIISAMRARFPHLTDETIQEIERLVTHEGALPQGAPTSPHLANLALFEFDEYLTEICGRLGARYTRYADDISISAPSRETLNILDVVVRTRLLEFGCVQNVEKTKVWDQRVRKIVTGLDVSGSKIRPPRKYRKKVAALVRMCEQYPQRATMSNRRRILGYLLHWKGVAPRDPEMLMLKKRLDQLALKKDVMLRIDQSNHRRTNGRTFLEHFDLT